MSFREFLRQSLDIVRKIVHVQEPVALGKERSTQTQETAGKENLENFGTRVSDCVS